GWRAGGWGPGPYWGGYYGYGPGWGFAPGFATGVIVGSAVAVPPPPPPPANWYAYCASKYRSFDPRTGTYMGYDGRRHPCT
ncbi:BA14K family protein, partial [Azorhizobium caulinodans]|uniref:BA14K family protein n=2 Tax=Azorhizobium caulinodans TaxID=7 RepID=UPI002FBE5A73